MDNLVFHYTTLDALKGIISNDICLWATRYDHLNDPHEQIWAKEVVLSYCSQLPEAIDLTYEHYEKWFAKYSFILSLCELPDYRNMWRLYCNDGVGVCLAFDDNVLLKLSQENTQKDPLHNFDVYNNVIYSSQKGIKTTVDYWLKSGVFKRFSNEPADELMNMCAFIKDDDFNIEYEKRYARIKDNAIIKMQYNAKREEHVETKLIPDISDVKYRMRGNEVVPYIELHFPASVLKGITIGYKYDYEGMKPHIQKILDSHGDQFKHVEINSSTLY